MLRYSRVAGEARRRIPITLTRGAFTRGYSDRNSSKPKDKECCSETLDQAATRHRSRYRALELGPAHTCPMQAEAEAADAAEAAALMSELSPAAREALGRVPKTGWEFGRVARVARDTATGSASTTAKDVKDSPDGKGPSEVSEGQPPEFGLKGYHIGPDTFCIYPTSAEEEVWEEGCPFQGVPPQPGQKNVTKKESQRHKDPKTLEEGLGDEKFRTN